MNPYQILNMPEDSDFEALKAKYETLKAEYGEERFLPGEKGAQAASKLTELEYAWKLILDKKKAKEDEEKYGVGFDYVEKMVKEHRYDEAQSRLDSMPTHDGEWHYYQALVFYKREWLNDSYAHLQEAVRLSPDNEKFKDALLKMKQVMGNGEIPPQQLNDTVGGPNQSRDTTGNCLNTCCTTLCCMECASMCCRCG